MEHFGVLAHGLSIVFECLLLALLVELFYLLCWRRRISSSVIDEAVDVNESTGYAKKIFHLFCSKKPFSSSSSPTDRSRPLAANGNVGMNEHDNQGEDPELGSSNDLLLKSELDEESLEAELMRLHSLAGPPRFLSTIREETTEDMESDDGKTTRKGSRTRSLSGLLVGVETHVSPLKSGPKSNSDDTDFSFSFNIQVKSSSSPPPKFKFLKDAEEKLLRRLVEETEKRRNSGYGSLLKIGVVETKEMAWDQKTVLSPCTFPSSSSQAYMVWSPRLYS
ncbi:hypothetical protein SAY86_026031 [Trapa natans]|uniref:Uncharacterized protein n=1 Tax=Trapa natans TaxID=22666 RepID=A0AAN7QE52_TRANT|nr:hypothetical protein SAY86_026031 [Trapa natans]